MQVHSLIGYAWCSTLLSAILCSQVCTFTARCTQCSHATNVAIFGAIVLTVICIDKIDYMVFFYLEPVNMYVNIFGIVFATGASPVLLYIRRSVIDLYICSLELGSVSCCEPAQPRQHSHSALSTARVWCTWNAGGQSHGCGTFAQDRRLSRPQ
jgi:hypothetical protein